MWILLVLWLSRTDAQLMYDPTCCCPTNGVWSQWVETNTCQDFCGGCGNVTRTRQCTSEQFGCPCDALPSTETRPCNTEVCYYPRLSCCPWLTSGVNSEGIFACLPEVPEIIGTVNTSAVCTCCPTEGIWSEWTITAPCTDTCGSCGLISKQRTCLSDTYGCPCSGPKGAAVTETCAYEVCTFPRIRCCNNYTLMVSPDRTTFWCAPIPEDPPIVQTTCCDPSGYGNWNPWQGWTNCTSTCGSCSTRTRTRTCGSAPYGCPCRGDTSQTESCGGAPCTTGTPCCGSSILAVGYDGNNVCLDGPIPACTGTWTDWIWDSGATCSDTCGNCGTVPAHRYCFPPGCTCNGPFTTPNLSCNPEVCLFPRLSCCDPFKKKIVNRTFVCG